MDRHPAGPGESRSDAAAALAYMPSLDGVRALAIAAVLAFHAGIAGVSGGFLGVDVFFVLSGYLITHLLLAERARTSAIDLRAFFGRRFRRLYPGLLVMLAVVTVAATLFTSDAGPITWRDLPFATGSLTNWWLIVHQQSYFESFGRPELLQHTWSLSIEWQFYLVWPFLLVFAARAGGRRAVVWLSALLALGVAAYTAFVGLSPDFSSAGMQSYFYYGTGTRAIGLLVGAFLAAVLASPSAAPRRRITVALCDVVAVVAIGALAALAHFVSFSDSLAYRVGFGGASIATALLLWAVHRPGTAIGSLLSFAPIRWVGTRSYGIYLWHWPVFQLMRPGMDIRPGGIVGNVLRIAVTLAIAELSYRLVERPMRSFRMSSLLRDLETSGLVTTTLVCVSCCNAVLVAGILQQSASAGAAPPDGAMAALLALPALQERRAPMAIAKRIGPWRAADPTLFAQVLAPRGKGASGRHRLVDAETAVVRLALGPHRVRHSDVGPTVRAERLLPHPLPMDADVAVASPAPLAVPDLVAVSARYAAAAPANLALARVEHRQALVASASAAPYESEDATLLGDSIMLAASRAIAERFRVVNVDAVVGRQADALATVVSDLHAENRLTPLVILDLGNNGTVESSTLGGMLEALKGCDRVVVVNAHVPRSWQDDANATVSEVSARFPNVVVADWHYAADGHPEYFSTDGVHPVATGAAAYAETIVESLAGSRPADVLTKTNDEPDAR